MNSQASYSMTAVKPRQLLFETAQQEIKAYITGNNLKPGDPLPPESELASQLSISRTSVREAVKALEAVGIIESRVGAGLFVRAFSLDAIFDNLAYGIQFDVKHLADVLEVRHLIEYGMAERVAQSATPGQIAYLRELLVRMRAAAEQGRYDPDLDRDFHQALYHNVANSVLSKILDVFWKIYGDAQQRVTMPGPADPMATFMRHEEIFTALEAGDAAALQAAVGRHWSGIEDRLAVVDAALQAAAGGREGHGAP